MIGSDFASRLPVPWRLVWFGVFFACMFIVIGAYLQGIENRRQPVATFGVALPQTVWRIPARVDRVVDGDTADVTLKVPKDASVKMRVRIVGIDTPERSDAEPWKKATEFAKAWCEGQEGAVVYDGEKYDSFGRLLADVEVGGERWSQRAIQSGHAKEYRR